MYLEDQHGNNHGADGSSELIPAAITDTGCERELNEDRYAVIESVSGVTWIVCDGMGGVTGGELAAQLAIDAMRRDLINLPRRPTEEALLSAFIEANRVIVLRRQNPSFTGMGTTAVAAMFNGPEVVIGNIGDSRAYLVRDYAIQQLTTDHTLVQEMVERGQIQPDEALSHPQAHILTRCIGSEPGLEAQIRKFWIWDLGAGEPRDSLLICSDGLYSHVSDSEVARLVSERTPQQACVELVELAKNRGGYDNITIAIIPIDGQLKREPPIGFHPSKIKASNSKGEKISSGSKRELMWTALLSFTATVLVSLGVGLLVLFSLS